MVIYPASGTGAWEAALVNTLSPGDRVLMFETGHFATLWREMAERLGLVVEFVPGDWRSGVDPGGRRGQARRGSRARVSRRCCVVHNETSTGVTSRIADIREAIDRAGHPALFMVDTISSLASIDYRHDEWGVDVTVAGSQKGLMLPPGIVVQRGQRQGAGREQAARSCRARTGDWDEMIAMNPAGLSSRTTPATNLLYGLHEALAMLLEEGLPAVFARHQRHGGGDAPRRATRWGLEVLCRNPGRVQRLADRGDDARKATTPMRSGARSLDALRHVARHRASASSPASVFRIGHLGYFNDLMLCGTLCGVEMGLALRGVPHQKNGVQARRSTFSCRNGQHGDDDERRRAATTDGPQQAQLPHGAGRHNRTDSHAMRRIMQ